MADLFVLVRCGAGPARRFCFFSGGFFMAPTETSRWKKRNVPIAGTEVESSDPCWCENRFLPGLFASWTDRPRTRSNDLTGTAFAHFFGFSVHLFPLQVSTSLWLLCRQTPAS